MFARSTARRMATAAATEIIPPVCLFNFLHFLGLEFSCVTFKLQEGLAVAKIHSNGIGQILLNRPAALNALSVSAYHSN
jgi:hypothetical protein